MPKRMKQEWSIPNFLLCGGYIEHLAFLNMWLVILLKITVTRVKHKHICFQKDNRYMFYCIALINTACCV